MQRLKTDKRQFYAAFVTALFQVVQGESPEAAAYRVKYFNDPLQWVADFVDIKLPKYDIDVLTMIRNGESKVAVFGPHGLGKSVLAALVVLWAGAVSPDCKIITTASAWRQLEEYLWPEIHKWHAKTNWAKVKEAGGPELPRMLTLECHSAPRRRRSLSRPTTL